MRQSISILSWVGLLCLPGSYKVQFEVSMEPGGWGLVFGKNRCPQDPVSEVETVQTSDLAGALVQTSHGRGSQVLATHHPLASWSSVDRNPPLTP